RAVTSVIPYDSLHMVPWRAVLRECGLPWRRLAFPVGFNFLLRRGDHPPEGHAGEVIALGHGTAGGVDLREEAEQFALAFGGRGRVLPGCSAEDVRDRQATRMEEEPASHLRAQYCVEQIAKTGEEAPVEVGRWAESSLPTAKAAGNPGMCNRDRHGPRRGCCRRSDG